MPRELLDRSRIRRYPLAERRNRVHLPDDAVSPDESPRPLTPAEEERLEEVVARIRRARENRSPIALAFGAHTIKNGLGPVLIRLMESGWVTHLATNGAGIIHDWELAFQGATSENVAENVRRGAFGNWEETGFYINLALVIGAWEGKGYGEAVGAMIEHEELTVPSPDELKACMAAVLETDPEQTAAAADLLATIRRFSLASGRMAIVHPWKRYSVQAAAFRLGIPFTSHPMFGHDIIYNHPLNHGAAIGRCALRDFLTYAATISRLEGGVYLSVGSAVMSPMIFEKSLSMAQNLAIQAGRPMSDYYILVVDLAQSTWDWSRGEPPETDPAYYLRFNKSFSRMGGTMRYLSMNNQDFFLHLWRRLKSVEAG
jgi:hypothetical protein